VLFGDAEVAPDGELKAAGEAITVDGGDGGLGGVELREPHRANRGAELVVAEQLGDALEVGSGTERCGAGTGQDQDRGVLVSAEASDRVGEIDGGGVVDGVGACGRSIVMTVIAPSRRSWTPIA